MWKAMILACAVGLACMGGDRAAAAPQQDPPRIPQALSTSELQRYGDMLKLSDDQRHAVEIEYERYLDEFEPLRAEMIEVAVRHARYSETEQELTASLPGFVARAQAADEGLFLNVQPLLVEAQEAALERVRSTRRRTMLTDLDLMARLIGDGVPDMRERLEYLNPPAEIMAPLEPALAAYEARLDAGIVALFSGAVTMCQPGGADPKTAEQVVEQVNSLRAMNRRLFDDLSPSLPEDLRLKWRNELLLYGYGGLKDNAMVGMMNTFKTALASGLADAERQAVLELRAKFLKAQDDELAKLEILFDHEAIRIATPRGAVASEGYFDTIWASQRVMKSHARDAVASLESLLGKERARKFLGSGSETREARAGWRLVCGVVSFCGRVAERDASRGVPSWKADPLSPPPLTRQDIDIWIAALGLVGEQRDSLVEQFNTYDKKLDEALGPLRSEAFQYSSHGPMQKREGQDSLARAQGGEAIRKKMLAIVLAADQQLLEAARTLISADADLGSFDRLARMRSRSLVALDQSWASRDMANHAAEVDLMGLLLMQHPGAEAWKSANDASGAYEAALAAMLKERFDAFATYTFEEVARSDGWIGPEDGARPAQTIPEESLHQRHRAVAAFNQEGAANLVAALPAADGRRLLDAFNRAAYPNAYDDPACMSPALERAVALADLDPAQREKVDDIRLEYNSEYGQVIQGMIQLCAACWPDMPMVGKTMTPDRTERDERYQLESAKLSDQRSEINRKALRGLRMALSPSQLRKLQVPSVN